MINFIINHNIKLGISLDGPENVHNFYRKFKDGKGTFACIVDNINRLQQKKIDVGILSVCSDKTLENVNEYYELFKRFKNIKGLDLIAPEIHRTETILTQGNFSRLLIALFDKWFHDTSCQFNIRILDSIIKSFISSTPLTCNFMKNCILQNPMLSISPQGYASPCDNNTEINLGNVFEHSVEYMLFENPIKKLYGKKENDRVEKCIFCEWYNYCHGGCPSLSDGEKGNVYCEDLKKIFSHISNELHEIGIYKNKILTIENIDSIPNDVLKKGLKEIYNKQ